MECAECPFVKWHEPGVTDQYHILRIMYKLQVGSAEAIEIEAESVDLVYCNMAIHWFNRDKFFKEVQVQYNMAIHWFNRDKFFKEVQVQYNMTIHWFTRKEVRKQAVVEKVDYREATSPKNYILTFFLLKTQTHKA